MPSFFKHVLMSPEPDDKGGGGAPDAAAELKALKESNAALLARFEALEKKSGSRKDDSDDDDESDDEDDSDLRDRARKSATEKDKKNSDRKALENALRFSHNSSEWLKQNESILPKDIAEIFAQAEKENYDDAVEKDAAIKAGILQSFFSVQSNLDLLTPGLKTNLQEYLALTKSGKQSKAPEIYNAIFEPAFEMLRREKRAAALQKGFGNASGSEDAYKNKLVDLSKKHYLKEKSNGT